LTQARYLALMPLLSELGTAVRQRRRDMGLSQQQLAELVALSRATINELETGRLKDLSARRVERVANELGFAIGLVGTRRPPDKDAIEAAARVASVSYKAKLPRRVLFESLKDCIVPTCFVPHLRALLEDAPIAMLASIADELQHAQGIPRPDTWRRMRTLAGVLKCNRRLWALPT
jgi:transcriptional regulator with XRE-family HTH domain